MENNIKIFRLDDYTWYAGRNAEECYKQYSKDVGIPVEELTDCPEILTQEQMDNLTFFKEGGEKDCSFAEHLEELIGEGVEFPCFFASTEY